MDCAVWGWYGKGAPVVLDRFCGFMCWVFRMSGLRCLVGFRFERVGFW